MRLRDLALIQRKKTCRPNHRSHRVSLGHQMSHLLTMTISSGRGWFCCWGSPPWEEPEGRQAPLSCQGGRGCRGHGNPTSRSSREQSEGLVGATDAVAASELGWRENRAGRIWAGLVIWENLDYK